MFRKIGLVAILGVLWIGICLAEETARDYTTRAVQLVKEGKVNEAMEAFSKAVELAPNDPMYRRNRSSMYAHLKQWDKAVADYDEILKAQDNDVVTRFNRGYAYFQLGKLDDAEKDFDAVIQAKPDDENALRY